MKSRYGTDNDLLLEDYNEYETSKDKEEEIGKDGKEKGEKVTIKKDNSKSFSKYLDNIKNMSTETNSLAIWGRPEIEGKMICEKYKVKIEVIALEEEPIDGRYIITSEEGKGDKVVRIVNYMRHFVPLLSGISEDITENKPVSGEEIFGEVTEASAYEQPVQQKSSAGESIFSNRRTPISNQSEQKPLKERAANRSIDERNSQNHKEIPEIEIGNRVPSSNQLKQEEQHNIRTSKLAIAQDHKEQKTQQERINTSASQTVHTDTVITISYPHEQKAQQEETQKKLINSYMKEAIYSIAAVITAIVFTASAIVAVFTQPIPLAFLAGVALVVACVCVYQLTQSHKDINELKSEPKENIAHTFLEETGLKIYSLIDKVASKA